jgi:tetratricopeptide (TPR) repeat protein
MSRASAEHRGRDLGRAGQAAEAVMLSEALAAVDPARPGLFAGEAAVALAEAGRADDARTKIAENTERWPDDVQVRLLAGDALAMLGNTEAALAQFQVALLLARPGEIALVSWLMAAAVNTGQKRAMLLTSG